MNFLDYWQYTDFLTKALFFMLIGLSVASWSAGLLRLIKSIKMKKDASNYIYTRAKGLRINHLPIEQRKQVTEQVMLQEINRLRISSEQGLSVLGTTAAIAPFLGLFGTVWGIFHALDSIAASGEAGLGQVAGPVGEALIMTGVGLAVAIPAVVLYNICVRVNRGVTHNAQDAAHDVIINKLTQ